MNNEYMKKYMKQRYHLKRKEFISLLGNECVQCGSTENLEIDHISPEHKSFDIGNIWSYSKEKVLKELSKCQILCKSCHKEKSDNLKSVEHGGGLSGKYNCKCSLCKKKKAEYMQWYKKSKVKL